MNKQLMLKNKYVPHMSDGGGDFGGSIDYGSGDTAFTVPTLDPSQYTGNAAAASAGAADDAYLSSPVQVTAPKMYLDANGQAQDVAPNSAQSPSPGSAMSKVNSVLKSLGLGGGNTSNTAIVGALTGLLSAAGKYSSNKPPTPGFAAPPLFGGAPGSVTGSQGPGLSSGYGPTGGYNYSNYNPSAAAQPGAGFAGRTQAAPKPLASYYTYGQGPAAQFFQQVNPQGAQIAPVTMARGGSVPSFDMGGMVPNLGNTPQGLIPPLGQRPGGMPPGVMQQQRPMAPPMAPMGPPMPPRPMAPPPMAPPSTMASRMASAAPAGHGPAGMAAGGRPPQGAMQSMGPEHGSRFIQGPGDGTSDDIDARLANGEYVVDAQTVSMLGNGDNKSGAKVLDGMRHSIRTHKGGALAAGRMAPNAKPLHQYMKGGK